MARLNSERVRTRIGRGLDLGVGPAALGLGASTLVARADANVLVPGRRTMGSQPLIRRPVTNDWHSLTALAAARTTSHGLVDWHAP